MVESAGNSGDLGLIPGLGRSPGERIPTKVFLPGESPWTDKTGRLYSPWGRRELDTTAIFTSQTSNGPIRPN